MPNNNLSEGWRESHSRKLRGRWADPEWAKAQGERIGAGLQRKRIRGERPSGYEPGKYRGENHWNAGRVPSNKKEPVVRECLAEGCERIISTPPSLARIQFCGHSCQARTTNRRNPVTVVGDPYGGTWPKIRKMAWERDGYRCRGCGGRPRRLEAHHLCQVQLCRELEHLVTLCCGCHQGGHRRQVWPEGLERIDHLVTKATQPTGRSARGRREAPSGA